jgi:hypothetical protein
VLWLFVAQSALAVVRAVPATYPTINAALDASGPGDTVLVAPGTYTEAETRGTPPFQITSLAFLVDGVTLVSEAGPSSTTLDLSQAVIVKAGIVVVGGHLSQPVTVEGFTLTGTPAAVMGGRGMDFQVCQQVTVRNCIFLGTGVAISPYASTTSVIDCEFYDCDALGGGAIASTNSTLTVSGCKVELCEDPIFVLASSSTPTYSVVVQDCSFRGNSSSANTGCVLVDGRGYTTVTIEGCWFEDSEAALGGGAIATGPEPPAQVLIQDNVFLRCEANGPPIGPVGGAIFAQKGVTFIEGNTFHQCGVNDSGAAAAIALLSFSTTTLRNNVFTESSGAAAVEAFGVPVVSSCNVFWDNTLGNVTGFALSSTDQVVDPLYCDPANDDLSVSRNSPCLPAHSLGCGQIGALGEGCGPVSVRPMSWGAIKEGYR